MTDDVRVEIAGSLGGERVDRVVAMLCEVSRSIASGLIEGEAVSVDGRTVTKPSERLEVGQVLRIPASVNAPVLLPDESVVLEIVYVDDDVIVIDKPAGLVVHPGAGVDSGTLVQGVLAAYPEVSAVGESGRPGIVHRLDRGTSGLLMVARSVAAFGALTDQLRQRLVEREYLGLVHGLPGAHEGVIDAPIGRSLRHPTRQSVRADGKPARTSYTVLERFVDADVTLLSFRLDTGRTHQIRVHADAIGHPLVGDDRYGTVASASAVVGSCPRPFLHARRLGFEHPVTGRWMEFSSALPEDLLTVLDALRTSADGG